MSNERFWVVVPAAGSGRRLTTAPLPKQYLPLAGRTVIEWALQALLVHPGCQMLSVALAADDVHWSALPVSRDPRIVIARGGEQRADSVRAGLAVLREHCSDTDWVLVHDAARPCLAMADLQHLLEATREDAVGGLLAVPLVDTLKRADAAQRVAQTVSRQALWRAQTPQMFRFGVLQRALGAAAADGIAVTDESQAVELAGCQPLLIPGHPDNLKITVSEDLAHAERILRARGDCI